MALDDNDRDADLLTDTNSPHNTRSTLSATAPISTARASSAAMLVTVRSIDTAWDDALSEHIQCSTLMAKAWQQCTHPAIVTPMAAILSWLFPSETMVANVHMQMLLRFAAVVGSV